MYFFLKLLVVRVFKSLSFAQFETASYAGSYIDTEHIAAVPLDAVALLKHFELMLLFYHRQLLKTLLVRVEHVFHHEHVVAVVLKNTNNREEYGTQGTKESSEVTQNVQEAVDLALMDVKTER